MARFKRIVLVAFTLIFVLLLSVFAVPRDVKAYSEDEDAWKKAIGTAIRQCYENDILQSPLSLQEYDFNHNALGYTETIVQIPNLNGNYNNIKCYELFNKYVNWVTGDPNTEAAFLTDKLGYTKKDGQPSGECFYFQYDYDYDDGHTDKNVPTDYICADTINSDGTIGVDRMTIRSTSHDYGGSSFNVEWENHNGSVGIDCHVQNIGGGAGSVSFTKGTTKWSDFKSAVQNQLLSNSTCVEDYHGLLLGGYTMRLQPNFLGTEATGDVTSTFEIEDKSAAAAKATKYMLGQAYSSTPSFTTTDTFSMYQAYVTEYYNADIVCGTMTDNEKKALETKGYSKISVFSDGKMKNDCYAKAQKNEKEQSSGAEGTFGDFRTFEQICAWMAANASSVDTSKLSGSANTRKPDEKPDDKDKPDDKPDDGEKTEAEKLEEACYRQAKSLGWIICPIIFGLQEVTTQIYEKIEPMIRVNDSILDQIRQGNESGSGSMFQAWNTFRGIANIIFVILFLFIIFSQLTGVGIDNYGIKKMLPKVIITAILVNISFLICALAVDTSNVLGRSLQDLFTNIAPSNKLMGGSIVDGTINTINTAVGALGLVAAGGATFAAVALNGWAIIIPILLFLLVMIISIIFALIVLGLRQAFVVILIVISPIAFACTLLPNTEKVFKKWVDFFKQILMVYPIVGGLIGAGYFVACMIFTSNADLIMTITAGMLCVAPYFMVPSLTRKSLAMAGNIGERLAGAGRAARNAGRRANNSQAVRNARERSRDGNTAFGRRGLDALTMKAANWANGDGKGTRRAAFLNHTIASRGRLASVARTNQNRVANSRQTAYGQASNAVAERSRLENGGYDARNAAIAGESFNKAVKDYESLITNGEYIGSDGQKIGQNDIDALEKELVNELTKENADDVKINALTNKLLGNGKKGLRRVDSAYSEALKGGKASSSAIKAFSNNIKNSHPEIADMMPSLFESSLVGAPSGSLGGRAYEQFNNEGIGSLNAAKMAKIDKTQLDKYLNSDGTGFADYMNESSRQQLASLASQALNDERISGDISGDNRSRLEAIARAGGQPVPSKMEGDSGKIHQAETVIPAQTEAARSAGANTATVRATQISDATRARAAEQGRVNPEVERAIDQSNKGGGRQTDSGIWLPS